MGKNVLVAVADGTEELEAVVVIDVLRRAGANVVVVSVGALEITASRRVKIVADKVVADCVGEMFDMIVLPGGMPGAEHLRDSEELIAMLKEQKATGRFYAAICAAPAVVLQEHGLLEGAATCYPSLQEKLKSVRAEDKAVVVSGNCITSQGPGTAIAFSLKLVELLFGAEKAKSVADAMLVV